MLAFSVYYYRYSYFYLKRDSSSRRCTSGTWYFNRTKRHDKSDVEVSCVRESGTGDHKANVVLQYAAVMQVTTSLVLR